VTTELEIRAIPGGHLTCVTTHVREVATELRRTLDGA
jgi:hypothetical protein